MGAHEFALQPFGTCDLRLDLEQIVEILRLPSLGNEVAEGAFGLVGRAEVPHFFELGKTFRTVLRRTVARSVVGGLAARGHAQREGAESGDPGRSIHGESLVDTAIRRPDGPDHTQSQNDFATMMNFDSTQRRLPCPLPW